jgi:dihydrofolate reductase
MGQLRRRGRGAGDGPTTQLRRIRHGPDDVRVLLRELGHVTDDPYIELINAKPKYVASRSLTEPAWNATLLGPDPSGAIAKLKEQPGNDLIKYGTSRFDDTLVRNHLIDEFRIWIRPVVVGAGQRLFEDVDTSGLKLSLNDVQKLENGSVILMYTTR